MFEPLDEQKVKEELILKQEIVKESLSEEEFNEILTNLLFLNFNERSLEIFKLNQFFIPIMYNSIDNLSEESVIRFFHLLDHFLVQIASFNHRILNTQRDEFLSLYNKYQYLPEIRSLKMRNDAFFYRMNKQNDLAIETVSKAYEIAKSFEKDNLDIFYDILSTYLIFHFDIDIITKEHSTLWVKTIEYFKKTNKKRSYLVVKTSYALFFVRDRNYEKALEILEEIKNENILEDLHVEAKIMVIFRIGKCYYLMNKYSQAEKYLKDSYEIQKKNNLVYQYYYFAIESLKFLSRSSVFKGDLEKSLSYLKEFYLLLNNLKGKIPEESFNFNMYKILSTLRFIFYIMDKEFTEEIFPNIEEQISKLVVREEFLFLKNQQVLLEHLADSEDQIQNTYNQSVVELLFLDDIPKEKIEEKLKILNKNVSKRSTLDYQIANKLETCKILLSRGIYDYYHTLILELEEEIKSIEIVLYKIRFRIYKYIDIYLQDRVHNKKKCLDGLSKLERECEKLKFLKLIEEIKMFKMLINSEHLVDKLNEQFKQVAFQEEYELLSKLSVDKALSKG